MPATLKYDTKSCGRCGGSGKYSYCSMYGSTCFGCAGRGIAVTAAGKKASLKVKAFIAEHFSVPVEALKAGDRITVPIDNVTRTLASVEPIAHYGSSTGPDGTTVVHGGVTLTFTKPVKSLLGPCSRHGIAAGTLVVKAVGGADWDRVVAFARTIKTGVTVADPVPVADEPPAANFAGE